MQLLSGGDTPVEGQPDWLQALTVLPPSRHFVASSQAIIYKGAGLDTVWPAFLMIAVTGAILLAISIATFRQSVSAER